MFGGTLVKVKYKLKKKIFLPKFMKSFHKKIEFRIYHRQVKTDPVFQHYCISI